jgi:hypothetical protein
LDIVGATVVFVGSAVAEGRGGVAVCVPVGRGVRVGSGVELGSVGTVNGVKVTGPKLNNGVGVAKAASLGWRLGIGKGVEFEAPRGRNKATETAQREQSTTRDKQGNRILPICPCCS